MTTIPVGPTREVEHTIEVEAQAAEVYRLIADTGNWPRLFPPTVHVEQLDHDGDREQIRIWATANGQAKEWTSRRTLDPDGLRITFRQERSAPPVAAMGGTWIVEPAGSRCRVRLLHDYRALDDDAAALDWIDRAVDRNSRAELAALRTNAELAVNRAELTLSFTDSITVEAPARALYDFVDQAQHWRERLPHVAEVLLVEDVPGLQVLRMDTLTKDGGRHTTESVRVCFPQHHRIVYKQTTLPALMSLHTGRWDFVEDGRGRTTASSQHTVVVNSDRVTEVLGPDATVQDARAFLRAALGGNSTATLERAAAFAGAGM